MNDKYVFIAPTIDLTIRNKTLIHLEGYNSVKQIFTNGEELKIGDEVIGYGIYRHSLNPAKALTKSIKGEAAKFDLSIKAPVDGKYYALGRCASMFNCSSFNEYEKHQARRNNTPPANPDQFNDHFNFPCAFAAVTEQHIEMNGAELHKNFFKALLDNREEISSWDNMKSVDQNSFWDAVEAEKERLSAIECPVLYYDSCMNGLTRQG